MELNQLDPILAPPDDRRGIGRPDIVAGEFEITLLGKSDNGIRDSVPKAERLTKTFYFGFVLAAGQSRQFPGRTKDYALISERR